MPPAPRDYAPGLHHVWVNATGSEAYYIDDVDRLAWIRLLVRTLERHGWRCIAFCQLTTHVHLILDVPNLSLPIGMKELNLAYSKRFNDRHARAGQFVRRRYGSRRIGSAADLVGVFAYVVLNSVLAGLSPRAEDWRWSSFATMLGITSDFPFVDARLVFVEFAGSVDGLRAFVDARLEVYLSRMAKAGV